MRRRALLGGALATGAALLAGDAMAFELIDDLAAFLAGRELRLLLTDGQSNMDGNVTPQGDGLIEHPRVIAFYAGSAPVVGSTRPPLWSWAPYPTSGRFTRRWATAREPLGWAGNKMGPGFVAAKDLADAWGEGVVVGIVPAAEGGKPLSYFDLQTFQYGPSILAARNVGAQWYGILFAHGESNAAAGDTQEQYSAACDAFLAQYRAALGAPALRLVCSDLAQTANYVGEAAIRASLADWPARDPRVAWIPSEGAASSGAHFTYPGYVTMGHRFATAMLAL
jgi:hypothetical protein